ncbi:hypothetical protein [Maledivibacter halophilus]|uniref:Uncharacterized protein n=1 Tax=Maledivibacter halophilus TaxID=36842 RepID=A0A1T5MQU2_9FIRM|nr:hypothetical protein [Maledivibacter halophilus]SKC90404.1 hypothetical protein SAMN02194393_05155 [Maledivibacter halophilus]
MKENIIKKYLSDAVIIAIMPIIGYLVIFAYEYGYAKAFNIPIQLININKTTFFVVASALWAIIFPVIGIVNMFIILFKDDSNVIYREFIKIAPLHIATVVFVLVFGKSITFEDIQFFLILPLIITVFHFGFPLLTQRKTKGYKQKLLEQEKVDSEIKDIGFYLEKYLGKFGQLIIIYTFFAIFLSHYIGYFAPLNQSEYLQINSSDKIVLRIYGENLICTTYNSEDKTVNSEISIIKIDKKDVTLIPVNIGPLNIYD